MKVDLGAGPIPFRKRPGFESWKDSITIDVFQYGDIDIITDIGTKIPLKDNSVSEIKFVEVIEHIPYYKLDTLISEIYRIMQPGGKMIATCPNFETSAKTFIDNSNTSPDELNYAYIGIVGQQSDEYQFHKNVFTEKTIKEAFSKKPFSKLTILPYSHVSYPSHGWHEKYHIQIEVIK